MKWFTLMLLVIVIISSVECGCSICQNCVSDTCVNPSNNNCKCTYGCKSGFYGSWCGRNCPEQCVTCGRGYGIKGHLTYHICYECSEGYHNGSSTNCLCPLNCQQCISTTSCTVCNNGRYGSTCQNQCPTTCIYGVCDQSKGTCSNGCIANFVLGENKKCNECIQGKYGVNCDIDCLSRTCLNNKCDRSMGICTNGCLSNFALGENNLCDVCISGKYGQNCEYTCPTLCLNNECDREDGTCSNGCNSQNIIGAYCNACINGMYGYDCQSSCPKNCKGAVCGRNDGLCSSGCIGDQFTGSKCEQCKYGFYGDQCSTACPVHCLHNYCLKDNGECHLGCIGTYTGTKCDDCKPGYYGNSCELSCPSSRCTNNVCTRDTGQCESCMVGMYGRYCNQTCSVGCSDHACNQLSGDCDNGCKSDYTGYKCCVSGGFCEKCENTTTCTQCITGYFGNNCDIPCPDNCLDRCTKGDGFCTSCRRGYFGPQCDSKCSSTCSDLPSLDVCDFETGKCLQGCITGYYNEQCKNNCSRNCAGNKCSQDDGKCTECNTGYHGDTCSITCSEQCVNNTCTQDGGECIHGCSGGFHGHDCSKAEPLVDDPESNITGPVAGSVSGVLVVAVIVVVVGFILFRRRKRRDDHPQSALKQFPSNSLTTPTLSKINEQTTYENEHNTHHVTEELEDDVGEVDPEYINIMESKTDLAVSDLYNFVLKADNEFFKKEFQQIPRALSHPYTDARKPQNKSLNRFKGMFPYDHSRVKLKVDPDFFINACYIDGYKGHKSYIASVGPIADITNLYISFWKMVWYEKSDIIVMLTNLNEPSGMKCEQYWPEVGTSSTYGDFIVTHQGINVYAEYSLTHMTLAKGKQQRPLTHVHYTAWPDKSVPDNVVSLVEFRQRVKAIKTVTGGPTIVHCSAGVGRTGTYIALDILTDRGKSEQNVNVFDCVMKLRDQRVNMVQTHEQYEYLHRCVVYTLAFGSDPVAVDNLQANVKKLNDKSYARQFQVLEHNIEKEAEDDIEAKEINKLQSAKNRQGADIPGNRGRPRLFLNRAFNEPDYMNAIYINSYKKMNRYIAAQTPLPETISDFLCLIYQNKTSCIVDMNDTSSYDQHKVGNYLPVVGQTIKVGPYTVSCSTREGNTNYTKSVLTVHNSSKQRPGEICVEHYQYTGWHHDGEVPDNAGQFVQFVNTLQIASDNQTDDSSPILIHCLNAFERSGLFCTVAVLLEKLEGEQQVSVGNTIRQIRLRRSKAIPNKAQYKFCHECAVAYTDMFSTYSNFAM